MQTRRRGLFISLIFLSGFSLFFSLAEGSTSISWIEALRVSSSSAHQIIFSIRLPQTLTAFVTGGLLALAGALMQILLRNPLADPYVLGTSGGAALVTLILMFLGVTGLALPLGAWIGSLLAIFLLVFFSRKNFFSHEHLILIGIALSSAFSALMSLILFLSPDHVLRGMLFWLVGDLSNSTIPYFGFLVLVLGFLISFKFSSDLNILARGEKEALALGVNVPRLKIFLFLLTALLTATAVTIAGCIGFIGLIIPHALRLIGGSDHRFLLPSSVLLGGIFLTVADLISRKIFVAEQLPVGMVMALLGIPVFLVLLQRKFSKQL